MNNRDEFYIGWEDRAPSRIGAVVRWTVVFLLALVVLLGVVFASAQRTIGVSTFEWGRIKQFSGVLRLSPYPYLLVMRPGKGEAAQSFSTYYLVATWKFGLKPEAIATLDGKAVTLKGTLIYRGTQTMIETRPDWIQAAASVDKAPQIPPCIEQGRQTLVGEIVDSKCFLGVMNPGQLIPHRACAIRCISGGVPPVLLVRRKDGPAQYLLLVSNNGKPVNKEVLDLVAEPIEVTGDVEQQGDLLILRANPRTYRRL